MAAVMRLVVCLSVWLSASQVSGSYIPQDMNRTLQNLNKYYTILNQDQFDGKHVFSREPLKGKIESRMLYMGGILEAYEKLIGHMLRQLPTPSPPLTSKQKHSSSVTATSSSSRSEATDGVRPKLEYILRKIQELKKHRYQEQMRILHGLQGLRHVQTNSTRVQSKALWELPWIFEEASSLADNIMKRRRRRRQARTKLRLKD
ncbi:interferon gamma 1 precursor [Nothobranchius furzeri]|uniref:Interferon gamma 1 n=2 Tax=Nothobranchius TaxID=28779 RepID=A0A8C6M9W0_NOTFU|nr:interferon gamma 1 precursor [Nothobranchius furzeri]KAF7199244.1 putative LOC107395248-like protein [Nothobranchius furzeri]